MKAWRRNCYATNVEEVTLRGGDVDGLQCVMYDTGHTVWWPSKRVHATRAEAIASGAAERDKRIGQLKAALANIKKMRPLKP